MGLKNAEPVCIGIITDVQYANKTDTDIDVCEQLIQGAVLIFSDSFKSILNRKPLST